MIKKFFVTLILVCLSTTAFSQKTASDYSYVVVPELFSFLHHEDQYQLNSLTKFLFNKNGFNAFFSSELPNVKRCDGLEAEVISNSNFIYTKLTVVLKDCYGAEIARSEEGRSKYKDYRKAYHEAIRQAFESIERMQVKQSEVVSYTDDEPKEVNPQMVGAVDNTTEMTATTGDKVAGPDRLNLPQEKYSSYTSEGVTYLLRKTDEGYSLYEESEAALDGLVLKGQLQQLGNSIVFIAQDGTRYSASFSEGYDLTIVSEGIVKHFKATN